MNKIISILAGLLFFSLGIGIVIFIDHQGGIKKKEQSLYSGCKHSLVTQECPFCSPSVIEEKGECHAHSVPEALCTICNPLLVQAFKVEEDWCSGHKRPESQCTICNPSLLEKNTISSVPDFQKKADGIPSQSNLPRSFRAPHPSCNKETLRIEFPTPEIPANAGLEFSKIQQQAVTLTRQCNAGVTYAQDLYAHLSSRAQGILVEVRKKLGDHVSSGETLAVLNSSDLGTAKAEFLQAQATVNLWEKNYNREKKLIKKGVANERDVLEAETKLIENKINLSRAFHRLRNLGLTDATISRIRETKETTSLLSLSAPFNGTIVENHAVIGEVINPSDTLFEIADLSSMWVILDVPENDILNFKIGMPVTIEIESHREKLFKGPISWISAHIDPNTRTLKARVKIDNPDGLLKNGMFAKASVHFLKNDKAILVPKTAVQWDGCCNMVFIKKSDTLFIPKKVKLDHEKENFFIVHSGLTPGQEVVTTGSFLLKTEILKGNIGAGCCEIEPGKG